MTEVFQSLISRGILQNLSKLISYYTQEVITNRRGVANALFGWLRSSSSGNILTLNKESEELSIYNHDTVEFKIRFLADMAFLLKVLIYVISNK